MAAGLASKSRPLIDLMIAVAQHALSVWRYDLCQGRFAVLERDAAQFPTISIEQVEGEEGQRRRVAAGNRIL
jgi:hypothetical protein